MGLLDGGDRRLRLRGRRASLRRLQLPAARCRGRCRRRFSHMGLIWMQGPCHLRGVHRQNRQGEDRPVPCFPGKGRVVGGITEME